jgi:hypothetical protein
VAIALTKAFEIAKEVLRIEEEARVKAEAESKNERKNERELRTDIYRKTNYTVPDRYAIVDVYGPGKLVKLRISSPTNLFSILLRIDGETLLDDTYGNLTETLSAYQEDSSYYLHLEEKEFRKRLTVDVEVPSPTVFNLLYAEVLVES